MNQCPPQCTICAARVVDSCADCGKSLPPEETFLTRQKDGMVDPRAHPRYVCPACMKKAMEKK